jgi:NitT/TauT family transport system substrate-binding protein
MARHKGVGATLARFCDSGPSTIVEGNRAGRAALIQVGLRTMWTRGRIFGLVGLLGAGLGAIGSPASAEKVTIGILNGASSWGFLIADERGYFKDAGIEASFVIFDSGAKMTPSLSTGEIDAGAGSASSGLYNAVRRGITLKIVADAVRNAPGYGQALLVRKELISQGKVKGIADLKGGTVAITNEAATEASSLDQAMKSVGLGYDDVKKVFLPFDQHAVAFQNGGIDASLTGEPNATAAVKLGVAVRFMGVGDYYPNSQAALVLYSERFAREKSDLARRFMIAYVKAVRDYNDGLESGHLAGKNADEIVAILAKRSNVRDAAVIRAMWAHAIDPDGWVNEESINIDWKFFKDRGQINGEVTPDKVLDRSFADAAVKALGPYKRAGQ